MTGTELKTFAETILGGDTIDEVLFYQLLNIAKTNLEEKRPWQFLKKLNSSATATAGQTYLTTRSLPTDFKLDYKVMLGADHELTPIPFEDQHLYRNVYGQYFIDVANSAYALTGTIGRTDTIYFYYLRNTDDITSSTSPVFPSRFHPLLGFYIVGYYQNGVDADDIFARMSTENKVAAKTLENSMVQWDVNLQARSKNNMSDMASQYAPGIELGMM